MSDGLAHRLSFEIVRDNDHVLGRPDREIQVRRATLYSPAAVSRGRIVATAEPQPSLGERSQPVLETGNPARRSYHQGGPQTVAPPASDCQDVPEDDSEKDQRGANRASDRGRPSRVCVSDGKRPQEETSHQGGSSHSTGVPGHALALNGRPRTVQPDGEGRHEIRDNGCGHCGWA